MREGNQNDKIDARRLAELLRLDHLTPVYHGEHGLRTYEDIASGKIDLKFAGTVSYEDIFGESHTISCRGILDPQTGNFFLGDSDPRKES